MKKEVDKLIEQESQAAQVEHLKCLIAVLISQRDEANNKLADALASLTMLQQKQT